MWTDTGDMRTGLTVMVTKDEIGEAAKDGILAAVRDESTLSFTYAAMITGI